jgi:uncharacterized membrane protein SpoIIM required for sporulation
MKLDRFLSERAPSWNELDNLVQRAGASANRLNAAEIVRLSSLYRSAVSDLAVARQYFAGTPGELRLQSLVARAYGIVYGRVERTDTVKSFFSRTVWRHIHDNLRWIRLAVLVTLAATIAGAVWALNEPSAASGIMPGLRVSAHNHGAFYGLPITARGGLAVEIFTNNILVSFTTMLGGFTFGILTTYMLAYNGLILGVLGALEWRAGGFSSFLRLVVPHGLLELSCIALAGAAGYVIAKSLIDPGRLTRRDALSQSTTTIGICALGFSAFLVAAGLTEGFITPWYLPTAFALALGIVLAGGFWTMVLVRGRRPVIASTA